MLIPNNAHKILDSEKIELKLDRMAFQALELTFGDDDLVILGIEPGGADLAQNLFQKIKTHDKTKNIDFSTVYLNKPEPLSEPVQIRDEIDFNNKAIIIVDDVGNTGRTLFYVLQPLTRFHPKKIIIAVLVDRMHKTFPINADIVGFPIATTRTEHIIVQFENNSAEGAYLF